MFAWRFNRFQVRSLSKCCLRNQNILVFCHTLHNLFFFANFLIGIWSNSKVAKIKESLREILENIVSGFLNQVTE